MPTKCEQYVINIDKLEKSIPILISSFNSASASAIGYMNGFLNGFGVYNCGEDLKIGVESLRNQIQSDNPSNSNFLTATVNIIQFDAGKCKGGSTNCSKDGCKSSIGSVNTSLSTFFSTRTALVKAMKDLSTEKSNYNNDIDCKKQQEQQTNQDIIDQEKNRKIRNAIIYIVVISIIIGVSYFLYKKYGK